MSKRYKKSEAFLKRAEKVIPLGSQTFSKSRTQLPVGAAPLFAQKARGSKLWDIDGNQYIDFVNSLASVTLGYADPDVTKAVQDQLKEGVIFSLPHPIETDVAELITELVPCAEAVRFGKNGSDATAGAIRVARAYTGRDRVAVCGYHGWQDWYIGSTARHKGVPAATRALTHTFTYNDINTLHQLFKEHPNQFAAVILEPMNAAEPKDGFLQQVKELAAKNGALLVFDETITGFRYANGGAQELLGITPDLATFGKGLANGYPVSAVAGRAKIMKTMEEVFFSFTFGGETLSLAAARATLTKLKKKPVIRTLRECGERLLKGVRGKIVDAGLSDVLSISGHPSWTFLNFKDAPRATMWEIKTLFLQEAFARGIFTIGTHNMSYAHSNQDIDTLIKAYGEIFPMLKQAADKGDVASMLNCDTLVPLFKLR